MEELKKYEPECYRMQAYSGLDYYLVTEYELVTWRGDPEDSETWDGGDSDIYYKFSYNPDTDKIDIWKSGENLTLWSVELEANFWDDDTFCGSYDDCIDYCRECDYKIDGTEARLAKVELDERRCPKF